MWRKSSCGENGANQMYLRIASQSQMVKKTSGNNEPFWRDLIIVCFSGIRAPSLYVLLIRIVNWGGAVGMFWRGRLVLSFPGSTLRLPRRVCLSFSTFV